MWPLPVSLLHCRSAHALPSPYPILPQNLKQAAICSLIHSRLSNSPLSSVAWMKSGYALIRIVPSWLPRQRWSMELSGRLEMDWWVLAGVVRGAGAEWIAMGGMVRVVVDDMMLDVDEEDGR